MLKEIIRLFKKDNLYHEAHQDACKMLNKANKMFNNACARLRGREIPHPDTDIFCEERKMDKTERAVRKKVLIHLSASGTMDTPGGITLIGIVIDIERVGDYTTNILELAQSVTQKLNAGPMEEELKDIENSIGNIFDVVNRAFVDSDGDAAESIVNKKVTSRCEMLLRTLMTEDLGFGQQNAVILALYVRYLKRVAAHLLNIATSLIQPFEKVRFMPKEATKKYQVKSEDE